MKTFRCVTFSALALLFAACTADMSPECDAAPGSATRAYGDKTPKILVLIETNDVNPLNAKSYRLGTSSGKAFIDVVQLWAATIHKDASGYPSLYFNDRLAPLMANRNTYIKPLQDAGIKVLLSVLGDWQGIGVGNMTDAQADRFADLLVHAVDTYGLDGLDFDDEYANYPSLIDGSYGRVIRALRTKLDAKFGTGSDRKLITVFAWGTTTSQIGAAAGAGIDFAYPPVSATNTFTPTTPIPGVTKDRWCPITIKLSQRNPTILNLVRTNAAKANSQGYGGIACVGLRRASDVDPLPTFNAIAQGAYNSTVFYDGNDFSQDWTPDPSGLTITVDDIP